MDLAVPGIYKEGARFVIVPEARLNYFPYIGCIFIHIPKAGGTSVSAYLTQLDEYLRMHGVSKKFDVPTGSCPKHIKAVDHRDGLAKDAWLKSFKFCIVRNPFDQMVSSYYWWLQKAPGLKGEQFRQLSQYVHSLGGFNQFIASDLGSHYINNLKGNPEDWFLDETGADMVDFFVKQEELGALHGELARFVEVPPGIAIPHLNDSRRGHYSREYNAVSRASVEARFTYVLKRFGYAFETH